jgi:hypothetical protein
MTFSMMIILYIKYANYCTFLAPVELDKLTHHRNSHDQPKLVLIEKVEPVLVYLPDNSFESNSLSMPRSGKTRPRRNLSGNPASSPINYQQVWPVLNAAKDRAVELVDEGHRRKEDSGVSKREGWDLESDDTERLTRYSRNIPEQEKLFQINNLGDLPMFRFG